MCGIVGVFPLKKTDCKLSEKTRKRLAFYLHNEILFHTVKRGEDATGISLSFAKAAKDKKDLPFYMVLKQPVKSQVFLENDGQAFEYEEQEKYANTKAIFSLAMEQTRPFNHIIGHTRKKTQGNAFNPHNNHPIIVGNIIGIHNGGVHNDDIIYKNNPSMKVQGEVDSEALIQLFASKANDREVTLEDVKYVSERAIGPRAVIVYNYLYPEKVAIFRNNERPVEVKYIKELGFLVVVSEDPFFNRAIDAYNRQLLFYPELPKIKNPYQKTLATHEGFILDITTEVDNKTNLSEIIKVEDLPSTVIHKYTPKNYSGNSNVGKTKFNNYHTYNSYANNNFNNNNYNNYNNPSTARASVEDFTSYTEKEDEVVMASATSIPDEVEYADTETITNEEIRQYAAAWLLSSEAASDNSLFIKKNEGKFLKLIGENKISTEEEVSEMVHRIYPKIFEDGFVQGFYEGYQAAEDIPKESEEDLSDKIIKLKEKLDSSTIIIANLKFYLMAVLIKNGLITVEEDSLKINENISSFIKENKEFEQVDPKVVMALYGKNDVDRVKNNISLFAKKVKEETTEEDKDDFSETWDNEDIIIG